MKLQDLKNEIIELRKTEKSYQDIRFCDAHHDAFQNKMKKISEYADAIYKYFGDDAKNMEHQERSPRCICRYERCFICQKDHKLDIRKMVQT